MAVSKLSPAQLDFAAQACVERCINGNHWPPDLAEFLAIIGIGGGNPFGLTRNDVMTEFKRYCRDRDYYSSAEMFPWRQPVLYWICTELRQRMIDYRLSEVEVEKLAGITLNSWAERIAAGGEIPRPTLKLEDKQRTRPAWMNAYNERKENAVNSKSAGQGEDIDN
ncbi:MULTISPECIES: replication protein P [Yersinia]|nr:MULTISPECIES: replication protein P [Yersinia]MDN0126881.1 replication protein P [Yersinia massiliensis]